MAAMLETFANGQWFAAHMSNRRTSTCLRFCLRVFRLATDFCLCSEL
ncbi:hypothetical protein RBSH_02326 [Rhodopirellula baltica SH28]|uniref:Uncharacterized protein n=1 Tax=Rhodopirellula baltica SH28 TaxID=993517 RepID=K5CEP8_RHOBT|nr:hypothetical protein RBSH_02326 [Rhodopirellula baltica SH28]